MTILDELKNRGIFNNITSEEKFNHLPKGVGVYIGFDPTADSLHLGNYIQISILKRFKAFGFNPIAVLGGATGMIGDPSGRSTERNLLDQKTLLANKAKIRAQLESHGLTVVDNLDFYKDMSVLDFLREVGKHLSVSYMINKDIVKSRLETGISFTEFSYQLIQGWDFKRLYDDKNVMIQVGGSDQWGNITAGVELIRKTVGEDNHALGITANLLTTSTGAKFGKSAGNAIWIDRDLTSPFALYQFVLNTTDEDIEKFFNWITFLDQSEIKKIVAEHKTSPQTRIGQKALAYEIVKDVHSEKDAKEAVILSDVLFGSGEVSKLSSDQVLQFAGAVPTFENISGNIKDVLVKIGAASSNREVREFLAAGTIEVNGQKVTDESFEVVAGFEGKATLIKRGKKKFFLIKY